MKTNKSFSSPTILLHNLLLLLLLLQICIMTTTSMAMNAVTNQGDVLGVLLKRKASKEFDVCSNEDMLMTSAAASVTSQVKVLQQSGSKEGDMITTLPGQPAQVEFTQYSGYITVDDLHDANLFYYFVEAVHPSDKPLLLWLNGGPGCSSLIGAMQEIGPFRVKSDGRTLFQNPYAWNNVANVLFLENPMGVGFSYSNNDLKMQKVIGDKLTTKNGYIFLLNWLERFPEYKGREFYIAGESYAGHYIPQLATLIDQSNEGSFKNTFINLKGIMIGNPLLDDQIDAKGYYEYLWTHAIISDETIDAIHKDCDFQNFDFFTMHSNNSKCNQNMLTVDSLITNLNIHNIYAPLCQNFTVTATPKSASIEDFDPCTAGYAQNYLNLPEVQKALHVRVTKLEDYWLQCSDLVYQWTDSPKSMLPILKEIINNNIRVWIYSGDVDGRVPVTSTRNSVTSLNLTKQNAWTAWSANDQVAGFFVNYEKNVTFVTVRGAGHMVPSYQPARSLELLKNFFQGNTILN